MPIQGNPKTPTTVTGTQIEHVRVSTTKPFAEVMRCLEAATGLFDAAQVRDRIVAGAPASSVLDAIAAMAGQSGFMRFSAVDHGAILRLQGQSTDAVRLLIGHPLIAARMTKRAIGSALYAPLSLLIAADDRGTRLEYDRPSTVFAQFGDSEVTRVALELDERLEALILLVTGVS